MQDHTILTIFAIGMLTILEIVAMYHELNGQIFSFIVAVIAGLAGYKIKDFFPEGISTRIKEKISK